MTNNIHFNKDRYIQLFNKEETLKNQGRFLSNENPKEYDELLSYEIIIESQIYYNHRSKYVFLIEKYLKGNIDEYEVQLFLWEFFNIFRAANKALEIFQKEIREQGIQKLATFLIDPKSIEFATLINQIVGLCEFLTFDPEGIDGITLDQFRDSIEKIFFKIQKCLDE